MKQPTNGKMSAHGSIQVLFIGKENSGKKTLAEAVQNTMLQMENRANNEINIEIKNLTSTKGLSDVMTQQAYDRIIYCVDSLKPEQIKQANKMIKMLQSSDTETTIILACCKCDLIASLNPSESEYIQKEITTQATKYGLSVYFVSALKSLFLSDVIQFLETGKKKE